MTAHLNGNSATVAQLPAVSEEESVKQLITDLKDKGTNFVLLKKTPQIIELQTILKDRTTSHSDFVFTADRLMRLVIEEGLNHLPYSEHSVITPTGFKYDGIQFNRGNCGVSLCRSGEAMEIALRQCCRSVRIGKILIGDEQKVLYARLLPDITTRRILLLYPTIGSGTTVCKAIEVLKEARVPDENIYLVSLFISPHGLKNITQKYPYITVVASDITSLYPNHFSTSYFGAV
uniref:Phosphoribosyltransferase domain-containing protein n=1 Tax=Caenorhabditis japonica TaxID=281687 RepID=A0A8R1DE98_CAEJA